MRGLAWRLPLPSSRPPSASRSLRSASPTPPTPGAATSLSRTPVTARSCLLYCLRLFLIVSFPDSQSTFSWATGHMTTFWLTRAGGGPPHRREASGLLNKCKAVSAAPLQQPYAGGSGQSGSEPPTTTASGSLPSELVGTGSPQPLAVPTYAP
jgi:hypothetical protein